jgi:3-hydroxybutyrate dehydrogenase
LVASIHKSAYVASKHGVVGLTKVVALETAGTGVTCNCINPGWVRTPLVEKQIEARAQSKGLPLQAAAEDLLSEKQPSKQFVSIDQLGEAALFLCSDSASQITGISLPVDGGWTSQ